MVDVGGGHFSEPRPNLLGALRRHRRGGSEIGDEAMMARPKSSASTPAIPEVAALEDYAAALAADGRDRALSKAQSMMYEAWERKTARAQKAMAVKALGACPLCADAFNLLADHATTAEAAADLYALGVKAGELALGPEGFREYEGEFWGFLETRPYMRARHGLALALLKLGRENEAIAHVRAMLDLNPNDNQGVRYMLLAHLLGHDDLEAVENLLGSYGDEWSVQWLYTRALVAFRRGRKSSKATQGVLKAAFEVNEHVPAILSDSRSATESQTGFVMVGSEEEAAEYVLEFGAAWRKTAGAVEWLVKARG